MYIIPYTSLLNIRSTCTCKNAWKTNKQAGKGKENEKKNTKTRSNNKIILCFLFLVFLIAA